MSDIMEFANREEFRKWLSKNCLLSEVMPLPIYRGCKKSCVYGKQDFLI